jgi:uncharacterized beta-barrel protein YwiB (DUF1934 family)
MKRVLISIETKTHGDGQVIHQTYEGKFFPFAQDAGWYLVYKEADHEVGEDVTTTLKVTAQRVQIVRTGAISMRQELVPGQRTTGKYAGSFGVMWMQTEAQMIDYTTDSLRLQYLLKLNDQDLGLYEVQLTMEDREKNHLEG